MTAFWAGMVLAMAGQPMSHVRNGAFNSLVAWQVPRSAVLVERASGDTCLQITEGAAWQNVWRRTEWQQMTAAVDIRVEEITEDEPGGFAFAAIYQYDEADELVAFRDFIQLREPKNWQTYVYTFALEPNTATVRLFFGFYRAHGRAYFDNWVLVQGDRAVQIGEVQEWAMAGRGGRKVIVWQEPDLLLPAGGVSPEWVMSVLTDAGIEAKMVPAQRLAEELRPGEAGVFVLPYGAMYPEEARRALIEFCASGGKLLVVGGYPMDHPIVRKGDRWVSWREECAARREKALQWPNNVLPDGGFERASEAPVGGKELDGIWRRDHTEMCRISTEGSVEGSACAVVEVKRDEDVNERRWYTWLPTKPGREYVFSARVRTEGVGGEHYAYVAVYQYAGDRLVKATDVITLRQDTDWTTARWEFKTLPEVNSLFIKMGFYRAYGKAWFDQVQLVDVTGLRYRPLNTSSGTPGDGLELAAHQMGMCDAHFPLKRVTRLSPAGHQWLIRRIAFGGPTRGWATVGVIGHSNARWIPLLDALDKYGRLRGAAGAMLCHYAGFYQGSIWAYFGVEDRPLFGPQVEGSSEELVRIVKFLLQSVFLNRLRCEYDCYSPNETVKATVRVANFGADTFEGEVQFTIEGQQMYGAQNVEVRVGTMGEVEARVEFSVPQCTEDLLRVRARLVRMGEPIDEMETGIVLRRPGKVRAAPMLTFEENYFRLDGRPMFLFGSDTYSNDYTSDALNPLRWDQIQALARDFGLQVYENLQYSNPGHRMEEKDWRSFEAMGQLLQKRGLVFMCGLLIGHNVAVNEEQLAEEGRQCFEYAQRLGKMPALLWYINGDYQLRYDDKQWLKEAWNGWLRERYGSDEALRHAWGVEDLPALGDLPFPPKAGENWADPVRIDQVRFSLWLTRRWNENHVKEIRRGDSIHAITSEYYSEPFGGIDQRQTIDGQDVSNFGFFSTPQDDLTVLPERLAINDLRAAGKGVSMGEYGVKTHPAWSIENGAGGYHIMRTEEEQKQLFMSVAAYALGMGACKIQNWCLRDADELVFPWGYFYPGRNEPKDVAYVHRNLSMMWRFLEPKYEAPETTIVVPNQLRVGNAESAGREAVYGATQALLRLHIPTNVLDDFDLGRVPAATRTLIWPVAVAADEQDFQAALAWVKNGGQLVVTGFPGWDGNRRAVGDGRLRELLGCGAAQLLFEGVSRGTGAELTVKLSKGEEVRLRPQARIMELGEAECLVRADDGTPCVVRRKLGKGIVVWVADPVELASRNDVLTLVGAYREALGALHEPPARLPVEPDDPDVHVMRQRTRSGWAWVFYDTRLEGAPKEMTAHTSAGRLTLRLRPRWPAVAVVSNQGRLLMVLGDAPIFVEGKTIVEGRGTVGLVSLDEKDIERSEAIMLCPFGVASVRVPFSRPLVCEWGEWRDGAWTPLVKSEREATRLRADIDEDMATLVGLVCAAEDVKRWRARLEDMAQRPWSIVGY